MSSPLYFREYVVVLDTTVSNSSVGSLLLYGGLTISNTSDVTGVNAGGAFTTLGGMAVGKTLSVDGVGLFNNDKQSDNDSTGALVISGGLGVVCFYLIFIEIEQIKFLPCFIYSLSWF